MKNKLHLIVYNALIVLKDLGYITQNDLKEITELISQRLRSKKQRIKDILGDEIVN